MQKPHRPFWVNKLPRVMQRHIGPAIEIFGISGLPFAMVPGLHQCNVCIKTKLRVWRAQKCNFLVSAKTTPTVLGQQTTPCLAAPYWARNKNSQNFGATYRHGTEFAPMQCLYCKEVTGVESPKMQFTSQCKNRTDQYGSTNYPSLAALDLASNRNYENFGATYRHGTVFAPMQCLY